MKKIVFIRLRRRPRTLSPRDECVSCYAGFRKETAGFSPQSFIKFGLSVALILFTHAGQANAATWTGGNMIWEEPDTESFNVQYNSGDQALFNGGSGQGVITINAGGVNPGAIVTTAGTYTFSGGAINSGLMIVGTNSSYNNITLNNTTVSNGMIVVGGGSSSVVGNTMTVTNANLWSTTVYVGRAAAGSNTVSVFSGTMWNMLSSPLLIGGTQNGFAQADWGSGSVSNNSFFIYGGTVTNVSQVSVGQQSTSPGISGLVNSMLLVTNSGRLFVNGPVIVANNYYTANTAISNRLLIANGGQVYSVGGIIGNGSYGTAVTNFIQIIGGGSGGSTALWSLGGGALTIPNRSSNSGNSITADGAGVAGGAVMTNLSLDIAGQYNSILLTNGANMFASAASTIGNGATIGNSVTIVGGAANSILKMGGQTVNVGSGGGATFNQLAIGSGGVMTNVSTVTVGNNTSSGNQCKVSGAGALLTSTASILVGSTGTGGQNAGGNSLLIASGGVVRVVGGGLVVGAVGYGNTSSANGNSVTVTNDGKLYTTAVSYIGAGNYAGSWPGYTISNSVTVTGNNALWDLGGTSLTVGWNGTSSSSNALIAGTGGIITNLTTLIVGTQTSTLSNQVVVSGGYIYANSAIITNGNQVTLNAGGGALSTAGSIAFKNGTVLAVNIGEKQEAPSGRLAAGTTLTITGTTLNLNTPLITPPSVTAYVIASYGSPPGQFAATNGLQATWKLDYNYKFLNQIALIPPPPPGLVITVR